MIRMATVTARQALGAVSVRAASSHIANTVTAPSLVPSPRNDYITADQPGKVRDVKWRFPADDRTQSMLASVEHGLSLTTIITYNSKAPITPDLMEEALVHLYNKVESLRLCLRPRQGQLWIADMPRRKLDFQVLNGTDLEEEHDNISRSPFNLSEGPVWKARLMPCPADAPCAVPEVKAALPYQCHLLVSHHHAFNDAVVATLMPEVLLGILDSLLEQTPVDTKPFGELRDCVELREEENRIRAELERDPERLQAALKNYEMSKHLPLLMEAYGIPDEPNPATKGLSFLFLDVDMEKMAAKCHSIGATLNSFFISVINMSMVEMVREAGLERDVYNISLRLPVSSRRLMKNTKNFPLGFHALPLMQCIPTPRDVKSNFWKYVQQVDSELREKIKRNYMCEQRALETLMRPEGFTYEDKYATRQMPHYDYLFTNFYSLKGLRQKGVGKNVQISEHRYFVSHHNENFALALGMFNTRGQALLQLCHSTGAVSRTVAEKYKEKVVAMLYDVFMGLDY